MYCKKCGTEQHLGQKFCPKCGTPFPVIEKEEKVVEEKETVAEDVKPETVEPETVEQDNAAVTVKTEIIVETPADIEKEDKEEIVENEEVKEENTVADDYVEKLKTVIDTSKGAEAIDNLITNLKSVDWEEKKVKTINTLQNFISDSDKLRKATIWIAIIAVLWFFVFNHGFSSSWTWRLFAIAFVVGAFYKIEAKDKIDELNKARWSFGIAVILGFVFLFHSPRNDAFGDFDDDINVEANSSSEEQILMKMSNIKAEIRSLLPEVEELYNMHQQHLARGGMDLNSPAWGRWQKYNNRINRLWDEYISLARQLSDNEDIIQEAKESRNKMDRAFSEMFVRHNY